VYESANELERPTGSSENQMKSKTKKTEVTTIASLLK
jgi:hypothetical protein